MVEDAIYDYDNIELILMPIVLNNHYHLFLLDKADQKYVHYSSLQSRTYDVDSKDIVRIPCGFIISLPIT